MIIFQFFSGSILFLLTLRACSTQNLHDGVDFVTNLSNSIIPSLFKGLSGTGENIVVSPFGLLSNLAIILEASDGKTKQEILRSLKISKSHLHELRTGFKAYCELFLDHASEQEAAGSFNSAAISSSFHLDSGFKSTIARNYCANISESNSFNESAVELRSDAGVMSHWQDFEKLAVYTFLSHQSLKPFHKGSSEVVFVPMIPLVGVYKNTRWENAQIILLPLQAKFVHLLMVVPDKMEDFDSLVTKLVNYNLPHLIETLPKSEVEVLIPQLTAVNKNLNLSDILVKSGIKQAFDPRKANLTKAADNSSQPYVKNITQNAYFSTSFVAVNSVSGTSTSLGSSRRKRSDTRKIELDRPFFFLLLHKNTQLALLAGKIGNPIQVPS